MPTYKLRVNGRDRAVESWDPNQPLLYVLRDGLELHGQKFGCGLGQCGAPAPVGVALGNAIFDATGVRLKTVPFTPARLKAAPDAKRAG